VPTLASMETARTPDTIFWIFILSSSLFFGTIAHLYFIIRATRCFHNPFSQSLPIFCLFLIGQTIKFYIFTGIFTPFMEVPSLCFSDAAKPLQGACAAQGLLYFLGSFQLYG